MIVLKHLKGPLSGQETKFGDDKERIVIGRDPSLCDVVFPPDYTIVGREHLALLRELSGDYAIEPFGEHYVAMNGFPVDAQSSVPHNAAIRLGRSEGPSFTVTVDHSTTSAGLPGTAPQKRVVPQRLLSRRVTMASIALALLVVIGLGLFALRLNAARQEEQALADDLTQQIAVLNEDDKKQAAARISMPDRERLARSVYGVNLQDASGRETLLGTAWPVRPNLLATNAHVAEELKTLKPGESMNVRPAGAGDYHYYVDQVQIHPGYKALSTFLDSDQFYVASYGGSKRLETIPGYDVALLHVKTALPSDQILTIAAPDAIAKLAPGDAVALAGYPYENMIGDNVQPIGRTPQLQVGNITSLSDYFLLPTNAGQRHLVQHNLPMAGGASGSPVINAAGQVVAIGSAGNSFMVNGQRIPNAALVNYAQRADALTDLLDGTAEAHIQADRTYWAKQTAAFKRGVDVLIPLILEQKKPQDSSKSALAAEYKGSMTSHDRIGDPGKTPFRMKSYSAPLKPNSQHIFIAYAQNGAPITSLFVTVGGKIVVHADGQGDQYAFATFIAPASGGSATLVVATPDQDTTFLVRDYVWQSAPS